MGTEEAVHEPENKSPEIPTEAEGKTEGANPSVSESFNIAIDNDDKDLEETVNRLEGITEQTLDPSDNSEGSTVTDIEANPAISELRKRVLENVKKGKQECLDKEADHRKQAEEQMRMHTQEADNYRKRAEGLEKVEKQLENGENTVVIDALLKVVRETIEDKSVAGNPTVSSSESHNAVINISAPEAPAQPTTSETPVLTVVPSSPDKQTGGAENPADGKDADYWQDALKEHMGTAPVVDSPSPTQK